MILDLSNLSEKSLWHDNCASPFAHTQSAASVTVVGLLVSAKKAGNKYGGINRAQDSYWADAAVPSGFQYQSWPDSAGSARGAGPRTHACSLAQTCHTQSLTPDCASSPRVAPC